MNKKGIISLLAMSTIAIGLVGCSTVNSTSANVSAETQSIVESVSVDSSLNVKEESNCEPIVVDENTNEIDYYKKTPEVKVFEPGKHVYMIRYDFDCSPDFLNSVSIAVPDGYEILDVENYISCNWDVGGNKAQTKGADVWYINNETVEVTPVYNEVFKAYDYSQPGKVVELENSNGLNK